MATVPDSMTPAMIAALFSVMLVLALVPGVSVLTVSARTLAYGFIHGAFTTAGIVAGDILFILIAIFGLSLLADAMGDMFMLVKLLGGVYLAWLAFTLWKTTPATDASARHAGTSLYSSFMAGLLITLADQKAILFYLGLFPAFMDLSTIGVRETGIIIVTASLAVGSAKLAYAGLANGARLFADGSSALRRLTMTAALALALTGAYLVTGAIQALAAALTE
jgi:threonine/homoserine/homoserine lactone efflux protein